MYCVESDLSKMEYLVHLRGCFDSPLQFYKERVTGIVIGPFFSVAHYCEYEWNRRITSECNRAWGCVKEADGKTEVSFIRGKGLFSPFWLIFWTVVIAAFLLIGVEPDLWNDAPIIWLTGGGCSLLICGITALHSSLTEAGEYGAWEITKLLSNPKDYYC